ncbi:MAG: SIMPL domain-containing protein [Firmicutes bacterium]|nr:SIMPL domain-containing protein [Bacillota bacterium]
MKKTLIMVMVLLITAVCAVNAFAQEGPVVVGDKTISVCTSGSAEAVPDTAIFVFNVTDTRSSSAEAFRECSQKKEKALKVLSDKGFKNVTAGEIRFLSSDSRVMMSGDGQIKGFTAASVISVTIENIDKESKANLYGKITGLLDAMNNAGASSGDYGGPGFASGINAITFAVKNPETLEKTAIDNGIQKARKIAEKAAAGMNRKITGIKSVYIRSGINIESPFCGYTLFKHARKYDYISDSVETLNAEIFMNVSFSIE